MTILHNDHKYVAYWSSMDRWYLVHYRRACCKVRQLTRHSDLDDVEDLYAESGGCSLSIEEFAVKLGYATWVSDDTI